MSEYIGAFDVDRAATYLSFTKTYLYKLVYMKRIAYFKPTGGKLYFRKEDLDAFIFRGRRAADYELVDQAEDLLNKTGA